MVANVSGLSLDEIPVLEVYRRLRDVSLPDPTMATVADLTGYKIPKARLICDRLVSKGYLTRGGRTRRSYCIPKDDLKNSA